jgi:hypothetical protein
MWSILFLANGIKIKMESSKLTEGRAKLRDYTFQPVILNSDNCPILWISR